MSAGLCGSGPAYHERSFQADILRVLRGPPVVSVPCSHGGAGRYGDFRGEMVPLCLLNRSDTMGHFSHISAWRRVFTGSDLRAFRSTVFHLAITESATSLVNHEGLRFFHYHLNAWQAA